jgi:translocation and assembly module TamB
MAAPSHVAFQLLRLIAWLLLGSLLALALGAAGLWWWAGREGSLAAALAWGERVGLQAQGVSGTLRAGGRLDQLSWHRFTNLARTHYCYRWHRF